MIARLCIEIGMLKLNLLSRRLHRWAQNMQFAQNSAVKVQASWESELAFGANMSLSPHLSRTGNADSDYANANYLLNVAYRWRKSFSDR